MDTSMYYTFSTISQVLAAFIALSGVFVIFKIQEIKKLILVKAEDFNLKFQSDKFNDLTKINELRRTSKELIVLENIENLIVLMKYILSIPKVQEKDKFYTGPLEVSYKCIVYMKKMQNRLLLFTKISMVFGILTILLSLFTLPFIPYASCNHAQRTILFITALIGTIISIGFMFLTIIKSLKNIKIEMTYYDLKTLIK